MYHNCFNLNFLKQSCMNLIIVIVYNYCAIFGIYEISAWSDRVDIYSK